ncbi:hypothetical protein [Mesorhizobium sp. L48C026A00]
MVAKPPQGDEWMHEAKFDGYRSQIIIDAGGVRPPGQFSLQPRWS